MRSSAIRSEGSLAPEDGSARPRIAVGSRADRIQNSRRRDKTALVLAGGGITGAVYEVGALRAIDDLLVDYTINDFDIYVGTSAGALICSFIANGVTPYEAMQIIDNHHPEIRGFQVGDVFQTNIDDLLRRIRRLPKTLFEISRHSVRQLGDVAFSDILWELAGVLPNGIYDGIALERFVRRTLEYTGSVNRFDQLSKQLFIVATELETGQRAVFGQGGKSIVPISQAVAASSSVPILYRPFQIFDRDYIDGGLHGSASIDLAIEAGAKLVVCINPMVPLNMSRSSVPEHRHYVRERGIQAIMNQSVRTLLYASVRYHVKNLRIKYPDVDIILVQPQWDDFQMFSYSPMHYGSRLAVAEHGFESVTRGLLTNFEFFRQVLLRHDIELTQELVQQELQEIEASGNDPEIVDHIIARRDQARSLSMALVDLEDSLRRLQHTVGDG